MAKLHCTSNHEVVVHNIPAVEFYPTSATLSTTNFFAYLPSATFCAVV